MLLGVAGLPREVVLPGGLRALLLCALWVVGLGCGLVPWLAPGARCAYCWGLLGPPGGGAVAGGSSGLLPYGSDRMPVPRAAPGKWDEGAPAPAP